MARRGFGGDDGWEVLAFIARWQERIDQIKTWWRQLLCTHRPVWRSYHPCDDVQNCGCQGWVTCNRCGATLGENEI